MARPNLDPATVKGFGQEWAGTTKIEPDKAFPLLTKPAALI